MKKLGSSGEMNALLMPLVIAVVLLFGALGFSYWAYNGRENYKNNADTLIAAAVNSSNQQLTSKLNAQFAQEEKDPLSTYNGPEAFGSLVVNYPRTWSAYVAEDDQGSPPIDGYFYPGVVPNINTQSNTYALRVQVQNQPLSQALQQYQGQVQNGQVTVKPYSLPKVPSVVGDYITGQLQQQIQGEMVLLPLRSGTLAIWTESSAFESDFNNIILPNFSFSP